MACLTYTWPPPHRLLLPLKLLIRRDVEGELSTTVATWCRLRRREFVRDKLLSVNHRSLINLGYGGSSSAERPYFHDIACAQIDVRLGRETDPARAGSRWQKPARRAGKLLLLLLLLLSHLQSLRRSVGGSARSLDNIQNDNWSWRLWHRKVEIVRRKNAFDILTKSYAMHCMHARNTQLYTAKLNAIHLHVFTLSGFMSCGRFLQIVQMTCPS